MYQRILVLLLVLAGPSSAENAPPFEELYRSPIQGAEGLETVVGVIERKGASSSAKHYHPNGEYGVILEGKITIQSEGGGTVQLESGDTFYQPPGKWHIVSTSNVPSKTIVFRVVSPNQPMVVPVP